MGRLMTLLRPTAILTLLAVCFGLSARGATNALVAPKTNHYHATWTWQCTNACTFYLNSNGISVFYKRTTNQAVTVSNLVQGVNYTAELYAEGNGQAVTWKPESYMGVVYSTNSPKGPWVPLPQTVFTNAPAVGFLWWKSYNNFPLATD